MTINKLITKAISHSECVFGMDTEKLKHKTLFSPKANDIHRLYSYITEKTVRYIPPFEKISNYNNIFTLNELSQQKHRDTYGDKSYELISRDGISLIKYLCDMSFFDFQKSSFPELFHFFEIIYMLIQYTATTGLFHYALPEYISVLADGSLPYEEDCFHNMFLIDFSESPDTVEAIKHFRLDTDNGNVRFIFKDYNTTLDKTFLELINKKNFIDFINNIYSPETIYKINNDILKILLNM